MTEWQLPDLETMSASNIHGVKELARLGDGSIHDLIYSPDGRFLAAGSSIGVWIYDEARSLRRLLSKDQCGYRIAISSDSEFIASTGNRHQVFVWRIEEGEVLATITLDKAVGLIQTLQFHPNQPLLAIGGWDHQIYFFDILRKQVTSVLPYTEPVNSIAFHPAGRLLAVGGWTGSGHIYDLETQSKSELPRLKETRDALQVAFSQSGQLAYGCGGILSLWETQSASEIQRLSFGAQGLMDITFSPSGTKLATANWAGEHSGPGHVRIFDLNSASEQVVADDGGVSVAFRPDEKVLAFAAGGWNSTIEFYAVETHRRFYAPSHGSIATGLVMTSDSRTLAYGASRGVIRLIDTTTGEENAKLQKKSYDRQSAGGGPRVFYPDEKSILFEGFDRGTKYYTWSIHAGTVSEFTPDWGLFMQHIMPSVCLDSKNGVLSVGAWHQLQRMNLAYHHEALTNIGRTRAFNVILMPEGHLTISAHYFENLAHITALTIHDFVSDQNVEMSETVQGWDARYVSSTDDGKWIAVGGSVGSGIQRRAVGFVWDTENNRAQFSFASAQHYGAQMEYALLSPNAELAIFADTAGDVFIWHIPRAEQIHQFTAHPSSLWNMIISPNGQLLISLGSDSTIRFWGVPFGES